MDLSLMVSKLGQTPTSRLEQLPGLNSAFLVEEEGTASLQFNTIKNKYL